MPPPAPPQQPEAQQPAVLVVPEPSAPPTGPPEVPKLPPAVNVEALKEAISVLNENFSSKIEL